jgi:hypothetical protein
LKKLHTNAFVAVALVAGLCAATPASAIVMTDTVNPTPDITLNFGAIPTPCPAGFTCTTNTLSFVHDITDSGFIVGDDVTGAAVVIDLTDITVTGPNNEQYILSVGAQTITCAAGNCVPNVGVTETITLNAASLADLEADGMINVTISITGQTGTTGFLFAQSALTAEVEPAQNGAVPEPSTMVLLGLGLLGFAASRRRCARR